MFIGNLNKRERYLAIGTVSIVLAGISYLFIIDPMIGRWKKLDDQIRSKVAIIENDSRALANQKMAEAEYAKLSKYAKFEGNEDQAVADTLAYAENVAKNDACSIINIKPVDIKKTESYKEILIDITADASSAQLSKFLYDIENPRENLIVVKRFTLSSKSSQTGTMKGTFLISKILLD